MVQGCSQAIILTDSTPIQVDENTPNSFSIFDADSVSDAKSKLKANVDEAVGRKKDPAERVASVGKPGESQEVSFACLTAM